MNNNGRYSSGQNGSRRPVRSGEKHSARPSSPPSSKARAKNASNDRLRFGASVCNFTAVVKCICLWRCLTTSF
jgi:hypothetical protein